MRIVMPGAASGFPPFAVGLTSQRQAGVTVDMPFVPVGPASALPPDSVMEVALGDKLFALCNVGGALYGLDGVCPHSGGPLGQGRLEEGHLICPFHMWEFDCATGEFGRGSGCRIDTFEVKVEDGRILLQVP